MRPEFLFNNLILLKDLFEKETSKNGNKLIFSGNGASAAIASHATLDFTKQAKIKSTTYHDSALMTAYSNDYKPMKNGWQKYLNQI